MRLGIVITRASMVDVTWTTVALIRAALQRDHDVRVVERADFEVDPSGRVVARSYLITRHSSGEVPSEDAVVHALRARTAPRRFVDVGRLDILLLRSNPLTADLILFARLAKDRGVQVVNDPDGITLVTSKAWLASLPDVPTPPTLVTRSQGAGSVFYMQQAHGVVVKPARGSGGQFVFRVPPQQNWRFDQVFNLVLSLGGHVVVQAYLPAADAGEKRLLWLDGTIIGGYLRQRGPGEFRHNLKQGGIAHPTTVTDRERALLAPVTPHLLRVGVRFAGLDTIGDHLVEINALNPGGTFHTDRLTGSSHAATVIEALERRPTSSPSEDKAWVHPAP